MAWVVWVLLPIGITCSGLTGAPMGHRVRREDRREAASPGYTAREPASPDHDVEFRRKRAGLQAVGWLKPHNDALPLGRIADAVQEAVTLIARLAEHIH